MANMVQGVLCPPGPAQVTLSTFLKIALLAGGRAYRLEGVMKFFSNNIGWEGIGMFFV